MPVFNPFLSLSALKAFCSSSSATFPGHHPIHAALALGPNSDRHDVLDVGVRLRAYNVERLHNVREWIEAGIGDRDALLREDACLRLAMQYVHYLATRPYFVLPSPGAVDLGKGFPPEDDQPDPETWTPLSD